MTLLPISCANQKQEVEITKSEKMMVRIAEVEIAPEYLEEYMGILKEESEASVRMEEGVISIFPMYEKDNKRSIRILEIYADKEAYELHINTPHFIKYKTSTVKMVRGLKLIEMKAIDFNTMPEIFSKLGEL
ncbi:antibiotic biosynthesis monooxygenase [Aurantibacter sp.]|uniref:putative quinol monooxygenase n=1 Tax=Aurantibacter sp. TaxID=2807103 RepID=UPI0032656C3B